MTDGAQMTLQLGCLGQLHDVVGPGGEPLGDGAGGQGAVVGELDGLFAEVVDELRDPSGHGDGKKGPGVCVLPFVLGGGATRFGGRMLLGAGPAAGAGPT